MVTTVTTKRLETYRRLEGEAALRDDKFAMLIYRERREELEAAQPRATYVECEACHGSGEYEHPYVGGRWLTCKTCEGSGDVREGAAP